MAGYTGAGVTIGVVDTGIQTANPELAGRISPDSADVNGNGTVEAEDDHGTLVAMVAAAGNNNFGTVGIAYDATILAVREDVPGSCASKSGCSFGDVSAGINYAVQHGAKVVNLSLGGAAPTADEIAAVQAAAAAGVVVVIAAGNDGTARPDPFPLGLANLGLGNVIIAGSVSSNGTISSFSDKARTAEQYYLAALGQSIYLENGGSSFFVSGTSFSAPQISGAVALLAQAFPSLTATQIVDLLFSTAQDVGTPGLDSTYGNGILDIYRAFQPQGTTVLADKGTAALPLTDTTAIASPAMGDALRTASLPAIVLDRYSRAFQTNLGFAMRGAVLPQRLGAALDNRSHAISLTAGKAALAFTVGDNRQGGANPWTGQLRLSRDDADAARVLAARVALRLSPRLQFGFAYAQGADGLVAQLQGQDRPAFLLAQSADSGDGLMRRTDISFALRRTLGRWALTFSAENGQSIAGLQVEPGDASAIARDDEALRTIGLTADRNFGPLTTSLGLSWMSEDRTILGARFHDAFGGGGAQTAFLDAGFGWQFAPRWRLGGAFRQGWTLADGSSVIAPDSLLVSRAWSLDLQRRGLFTGNDSIGLRIAQPLRVESGGLRLDLPVTYDYSTMSAGFATSLLPLAPQGREVLGELAWRGPLWGGDAAASLFYRTDPGNYASLPDDKGVAVKWSTGF